MKSISLQLYYDMLARHDWHYTKTESLRHYEEHSPWHLKLQRLSVLTPQHKALYDQWEHYALTQSEDEKPKRPEAE